MKNSTLLLALLALLTPLGCGSDDDGKSAALPPEVNKLTFRFEKDAVERYRLWCTVGSNFTLNGTAIGGSPYVSAVDVGKSRSNLAQGQLQDRAVPFT